MKNKRLILIMLILGIVLLTFGFTYAIFEITKIGKNNSMLVAGDIYMHYKEENVYKVNDATPRDEYDPGSYFEFTIDGKNEYTKKDIWYNIEITYGDSVEGKKIRISDYLLKFRLVETRNGVEKVLFDNKSYNNIKNKTIWVDKIEKDTREEIKITYKLYMWISNDLEVGNTNTANYTNEVWNNDLYASIKVNVKGDLEEKKLEEEKEELAVETVKKKVNQNGQVIAIDENSNICYDMLECEIREYRYSGRVANNFVKLNNNNQDELWRIIGVFRDEDTDDEYLKIVRNDVLPKEIIPNEYVIDGTTYKISANDDSRENSAYWNYITGSDETNDWSKAGAQYYLNTLSDTKGTKGYLSYLSSGTKSMLKDEKYYFGTIDNAIGKDNTILAYEHERDVKNCKGNTGVNQEEVGCRVWAGNQATWTGTVGLMYASDVGFTYQNTYWEKDIFSLNEVDISNSWQKKELSTINYSIWLMNNPVYSNHTVPYSGFKGDIRNVGVSSLNNGNQSLQPVLAIKHDVKISSGSGTESNPYTFELSN